MRGLTLRGAEGATCNVNSIAGPLAACGMACGGAILSARKRAMEPTSAPWRMAASLDCVRSCTPLSFVSRCRGSTRTFRLSKRAFVVMPRIDRPVVWGRAASGSASARLSLRRRAPCGLPGRSRSLHRVLCPEAEARAAVLQGAARIPLPARRERGYRRIARSQGRTQLSGLIKT